ncbi:hypothetical protein BD289DRAFT_222230 [Coniella lustricola]|uniref:Uncharacterized protein n=1 Tax=Coniella lustricola TaxID=2025994 RepID=A0A2T3AB46_9PEZI|nr:hypothetical protein BD289DRAFT_222230 [Coniella lustricola]
MTRNPLSNDKIHTSLFKEEYSVPSPPTSSETDDMDGSLTTITSSRRNNTNEKFVMPICDEAARPSGQEIMTFNSTAWLKDTTASDTPISHSITANEQQPIRTIDERPRNLLEQEDIQFFHALIGGIDPSPATTEAQNVLTQESKARKRSRDAEAQQSSTRQQEEINATWKDLSFWMSLIASR